MSLESAKRLFATLVADLERDGYLGRVFPTVCVDDPYGSEVDRSAVLAQRVGIDELWPLGIRPLGAMTPSSLSSRSSTTLLRDYDTVASIAGTSVGGIGPILLCSQRDTSISGG